MAHGCIDIATNYVKTRVCDHCQFLKCLSGTVLDTISLLVQKASSELASLMARGAGSPIEAPRSVSSGFVPIDEGLPSIPMSRRLYDELLLFVDAARRQKRIEEIMSLDVDIVNQRIGDNRAHRYVQV